MASFKDLFHFYRRTKKVRQKVLAGRLRVDPSLISAIECGRRLPPAGSDFLQRLCNALGLNEIETAQLGVALNAERCAVPTEQASTDAVDEQLVKLRGILRGLDELSHPELEVVQLALDWRLWGEKRSRGKVRSAMPSGAMTQVEQRGETAMCS